MCDGICVINVGDLWSCNGECFPTSMTCDDQCQPGRVNVDGLCKDPSEICPDTDQCVTDADCQDGASCVLQGSKFYCQCGLGYYLSDVSTTSCPMTGTCSQMSESTRCDCLSSGDITVCPFCNATTSEKTYQYNDISTGTKIYQRKIFLRI